jgi:hypothetical protein
LATSSNLCPCCPLCRMKLYWINLLFQPALCLQLGQHAQKHSSFETRVDLHDGLDYSLQSYWHLCNLLHFCVCMVRMSLLWFLHMMAMPTGLQGTLMSNCLCTDQESLCVLLSWHRGTNPLCVASRRPSELTSWCCFLLVLW